MKPRHILTILVAFVSCACLIGAVDPQGRRPWSASSLPPFTVYDDDWNEFRFPLTHQKGRYHFLYFENTLGLKDDRRKAALELLEKACAASEGSLPVTVLLGPSVTYAEIGEFRSKFPSCIRFFLSGTSDDLAAWLEKSAPASRLYPKSIVISPPKTVIFESRSPMYALAYLLEYADGPGGRTLAEPFQEMVDSIESDPPHWQAVLTRLRSLPPEVPRRTLVSLLAADAYRLKSGGVPDSYATVLSAYSTGIPYLLDHFLDSLLTQHIVQFFHLDAYDPLDQITGIFNTAIDRGTTSPFVNTSAAYLNLITGKADRAERALSRFPRTQWDRQAFVLSAISDVYQGHMGRGLDTILPLLRNPEKSRDVLRDLLNVLIVMEEYHKVRGKELPTEILVLMIGIGEAYGYRNPQRGSSSLLRLCAERADRWGAFCRSHRRAGQITFAEIRKAAS